MFENRVVKHSAGALAAACAAALLASASGCTYHGSGSADNRVTICHNGTKTMVVPPSAVAAHREHGDRYGHCG